MDTPVILAVLQPLAAAGSLRPGHFARQDDLHIRHQDGTSCPNCVTGLSSRYRCVRCSLGGRDGVVAQSPRDGPRVCRRHKRWIGPGTAPQEQFDIGQDVLQADRRYARMRCAGYLDTHRLAEILVCVDLWDRGEAQAELDAAQRFTLAVNLAHRVLAPSRVDAFVERTKEPAERYALLTDTVSAMVGERGCVVLVDALWTLLRTAAHVPVDAPHRMRVPAAESNVDDAASLAVLRSWFYPRSAHLHLSQYADSDRAGSRFERMTPHVQNRYVCGRGHRFATSPVTFTRCGAGVGCGVCSNKQLLRGFNTLADTHRDVAAAWHPEANGTLTPFDVVAGSQDKVAWLCTAGHTCWQSPSARALRGIRCSFCSNYRADPRTNALSLTHSVIAAEWHPTLNGELTPENVVAGSERSVWWVCPEEGHEYEMLVARRTRGKGRGCTVCARQRVHTSTSLAVTHPDVAARWHPTKNRKLTPNDVLSGTTRKVWWTCNAQNHAYYGSVEGRTLGHGCPICTRRSISKSNCMRKTHPHLAAELHPTKNGDVTPDNVLASTAKQLWWQCPRHQHVWRTAGATRVRGTGCPYCVNRLVWVGFNDMATTRPDLASQWHPTRNGDLHPTDVVAGTNKVVWWRCDKDSTHEWAAKANNRVTGSGCPKCWEGH